MAAFGNTDAYKQATRRANVVLADICTMTTSTRTSGGAKASNESLRLCHRCAWQFLVIALHFSAIERWRQGLILGRESILVRPSTFIYFAIEPCPQ